MAARLLTWKSGGWVLALALAVATAGTLWNLAPLFSPSRERPRGDGRTPASYGFDLSNALVSLDTIASSGLTVDGIPALDDPAVIRPDAVERSFLVGSDKVVGVVLGGEARAYPLRMLVWHEIVNDVVAGVPVAVTYNPISEGTAVFDRRVAGETLAFGVSGLLFQSNLLLYDRSSESLWSQLQGRAISGPHAGRRSTLDLVPFALCRWEDWRAAYPATSVLAPIPSEAKRYRQDVYATYANTETLRYPVDPLPPAGGLARKARIFAAPSSGGWTVTALAVAPTERRFEVTGPSGTEPVIGYYAYWFAWYATHPD